MTIDAGIFRLAAVEPTFVEAEVHLALRIVVLRLPAEGPDLDIDIELLPDFTREGALWRFSNLDFAAGKFPQPGMKVPLRALADKESPFPPDNAGDDFNPW